MPGCVIPRSLGWVHEGGGRPARRCESCVHADACLRVLVKIGAAHGGVVYSMEQLARMLDCGECDEWEN